MKRRRSWSSAQYSSILAIVLLLIAAGVSAAPPGLVLDEPANGDTYDDSITVSGLVFPSPSSGRDRETVDVLEWHIPELGRSDYIMFHRAGGFTLEIPVGDFRGPVNLELRVRNGRGETGSRSVRLTWAEEKTVPGLPEPPDEEISGNPITINSPAEGSGYRSFVEVTGSVSGTPESLSWKVDALDAEGPIELRPDGLFGFAFSTSGYSRPFAVEIIAAYPAETVSKVLNLVNLQKGPFLRLLEPADESFYGDHLDVSGIVGNDPETGNLLEDVKGLYWRWQDDGNPRRPLFFDAEGAFSFEVDMQDYSGELVLELAAEDFNGNISLIEAVLPDGRLPAELNLQFPPDGRLYGDAGFNISGSLEDPYREFPFYGGYDSLEWLIRPVDARLVHQQVSGEFLLDDRNHFRIPVLPEGIEGDAELVLTARGRNGSTAVESRILQRGGSDIPSFAAVSGDQRIGLKWDTVPDALELELTVESAVQPPESRILPGSADSTTVDRLENGHLYTFRLTARTPREDFVSDAVDVIPLASDTLQPVASEEYRQIRLTWRDIPGASSFVLYRATGKDGRYEILADGIDTPGYVDSNVVFGPVYRYAVAPSAFPGNRSLAISARSLAAPEQKLEEVALYRGLVPRDFDIQGDYAFVAAGTDGFRIIDVTDPVKPVVVGVVDSPEARGIVVQGDYAYLADMERGLTVINITAPTRPLEIGARSAGSPAGIAVKDSFVYIADPTRGLRIFDVSNASRPERTGILEGFSARHIVTRDSWAYVSASDAGLLIMDLEIPDSPRVVSSLAIDGAVMAAIEEDIAAVVDESGDIHIIDITDRTSPVKMSVIPAAEAGYLTLRNGHVFIAAVSGGLAVYDVQMASEPEFFEYSAIGNLGSLGFKDDYLYAAVPEGIKVIQTYITGVSYPSISWETPGKSHGISFYEDHLLVADHEKGVSAYTVDGGEAGNISSEFAGKAVVRGQILAIADGHSGPHIYYRETTGDEWIETPHGFFSTNATDIGIFDDIVAAAVPESGIQVFYNGDFSRIPEDRNISFPGVRRLCISGNRIAGVSDDTVMVFDGTPETGYTESFRFEVEGITDIDSVGGVLFVSTRDSVHVLDPSASESPILARIPDIPHIRSITVRHGIAVVSAGPEGIVVLNISRPAAPFIASRCPDVFAVDAAISTDGRTAYVVDISGVIAIDLVIPEWLR